MPSFCNSSSFREDREYFLTSVTLSVIFGADFDGSGTIDGFGPRTIVSGDLYSRHRLAAWAAQESLIVFAHGYGNRSP